MKKDTYFICLIFCLSGALMLCSFQQPSEKIRMGDYYFSLMRYRDAIAWYNLDSSNAEAQWKIAKAAVCYGEHAPAAEKQAYFTKAMNAAKRCIQLEETNANGHTWLAASLGNVAMYEGSSSKVKLSKEIKEEVQRALALNPNDDVAWSILGSFYREVAHISWVEKQLALAFFGRIPEGTYEESEKAFLTATSLSPHVMRHWYELGLLYVYWDKPLQAKIAFAKAKACPISVAGDNDRLLLVNAELEKLN